MATKDWNLVPTVLDGRRVKVVSWNLEAGDTPIPFVIGEHKDKTVLFEGNFGTGSMALAGSVNPTEGALLYTLHEANSGTAISSVTSPRLYCILEHVYQVAPVITGSIGSLNVYILTGDT